MARAMDTLSQFATTLHGFPTESVQVVATYILRNCKNLTELQQKAYFTLLMLSGQKKPIIYQGVANYEHDSHNRQSWYWYAAWLVIGQHLTHKLLSSQHWLRTMTKACLPTVNSVAL